MFSHCSVNTLYPVYGTSGQRCLGPAVRVNNVKEICDDIVAAFTRILGVKMAERIKGIFQTVIHENGVCAL